MFIDFSPEKKSHIKTEIMKSLKTRNESPVHYKYTWQRCANQNRLFAAGCSGQEAFAMSGQRLFFSLTHVTPRVPQLAATHGHAHTAVSHPHCRTPGDALPASHQRTGVYHVENFPLILQKDPCRQVPDCAGSPEGTDTPPSGCRIEPGVNQQFLLWIFFFFLMQLFNLSS